MMKIIIFLVFLVGCAKDPEHPGYEYMPEMVYSQAVEAYSDRPMLNPPPKSIPRGYVVFNYANTDDDKERAGEELSDPRGFSEKRLARGKYLYENFCLVCHGKTGEGDGPVASKYSEPPAFSGRALRSYNPGMIYHAIVKGYGDMPSHANQLDDNDRWDLILYVQRLQKPQE